MADKTLISAIEDHADERYVELADGADARSLLKALVDSGAEVSKFEKVEPSLNDIFIEQVGGVR